MMEGVFSTHAPFGDLLRRAVGVWSQELPELGKGLGQGIRAPKDGMKEALPDSGKSTDTAPKDREVQS